MNKATPSSQSRKSAPEKSRRPKAGAVRSRTAMREAAPHRAVTRRKPVPHAKPRPGWQRGVLALMVVVVLSLLFYVGFVRPYAYRWKPCYGYKGYGVCLPCDYEVHGLDISHYQGRVDWEQLTHDRNLRFPLCFVFMKATEGGDLADDVFPDNFREARAHGFIRGAYHYFVPKTDARRQAEFFISRVQLEEGDLPPVLDVETTGRLDDDELQRRVRVWMDCVEAHYGVRPILYTGYKFRMRHLNDTLFNRYPYWIAHYYVDSVRYDGPWQFWQHTDAGSVPGIKEQVDLNVFRGSLEELKGMTLPSRSAVSHHVSE